MTPNELRNARKGRGWTQKQLADLLGVSARTVEGWESLTASKPIPESKIRLIKFIFAK